MANARCLQRDCGYYGLSKSFKVCVGVYHDLRCPKCGTTDIDTTEIAAEWENRGEEYGYGNNNTLEMEGKK